MIAQRISISYTVTKSKSGHAVSPCLSIEIILEEGENRTAALEQTMAYARELVTREATQALASIVTASD